MSALPEILRFAADVFDRGRQTVDRIDLADDNNGADAQLSSPTVQLFEQRSRRSVRFSTKWRKFLSVHEFPRYWPTIIFTRSYTRLSRKNPPCPLDRATADTTTASSGAITGLARLLDNGAWPAWPHFAHVVLEKGDKLRPPPLNTVTLPLSIA